MLKTCTTCSISKPNSDFYPRFDGFEDCCKKCKNARCKSRNDRIRSGTYEGKVSVEGRSDLFISRSRDVHAGIYTYENVVYAGNKKPVEIFCSKHQGYFMQIPLTALRHSH